MRHVIWNEQANEKTLGPGLTQGINQVRALLLSLDPVGGTRSPLAEYNQFRLLKGEVPLRLAAQGPFDGNLRMWVRAFQAVFNRSKGPVAKKLKAKLPGGKLNEKGDIDWGTRVVMGIDEALATDNAIQLPDGIVARQRPLTSSELNAAESDGRFVGSAYRVDGLEKLCEKLALKDLTSQPAVRYRVAPLPEGNFIVPEGHPLYDDAAAESECAALVQCLGVSNTKLWRRGPQVQKLRLLEPGTVIATLGTGVYLSDYSGQSHVGIFLGKDARGLWMLDQYVGRTGTIGIRKKLFGAAHREVKLKPSECLGRSYRRAVTGEDGKKVYGHDSRYQTVRTRIALTHDGSEYYVLLDNGTVARHDKASADARMTREESKEFVKDLVNELFEPVREHLGPGL